MAEGIAQLLGGLGGGGLPPAPGGQPGGQLGPAGPTPAPAAPKPQAPFSLASELLKLLKKMAENTGDIPQANPEQAGLGGIGSSDASMGAGAGGMPSPAGPQPGLAQPALRPPPLRSMRPGQPTLTQGLEQAMPQSFASDSTRGGF